MRKLVVISLFLVCVAIITGAFIYRQMHDSKEFVKDFHQVLRGEAAASAYDSFCPVIQRQLSKSDVEKIEKAYTQNSSHEITYNSKLDPSAVYDKYVKGYRESGPSKTNTIVYRTGKIDVGVVLEAENNSYCVLAIETKLY